MSKNGSATPGALESVRRKLEHWRKTRDRRGRMPESLWSAAVALARQGGMSRTARLLRLDYYALKKRVESERVPSSSEGALGFLELLPTAAVGSRFSECVVEFETGHGSRMRVAIKNADTTDLVALSHVFWSQAE